MKKYTVYFELFGKKMKTVIFAENEDIAKEKIKNKIIFHKIELTPKDEFDKTVKEMFDYIFGKK